MHSARLFRFSRSRRKMRRLQLPPQFRGSSHQPRAWFRGRRHGLEFVRQRSMVLQRDRQQLRNQIQRNPFINRRDHRLGLLDRFISLATHRHVIRAVPREIPLNRSPAHFLAVQINQSARRISLNGENPFHTSAGPGQQDCDANHQTNAPVHPGRSIDADHSITSSRTDAFARRTA
jgi:hypothetical protein